MEGNSEVSIMFSIDVSGICAECNFVEANEAGFSSTQRTSREAIKESKYGITNDFLHNSEALSAE